MAANNTARKTEDAREKTTVKAGVKTTGKTRASSSTGGGASGRRTTGNTGSGNAKKAAPASVKNGTSRSRNAEKDITSGVRTVASEPARRPSANGDVFFEVRDICIFVAMLLLNLCMFLHTKMGAAGRLVYSTGIGVFGFSAFLLCLYLLAVSVLWMADRLRGNGLKVAAVLGVILGFSVLLYVINGDLSVRSLSDMYKNASIGNGGAFGGFLAVRLVRILGRIGSMIVVLLLLLITIVIVSEKSITRGVGRMARSTAREVRTLNDEHRRSREERRRMLEEKEFEDQQAMAGLSRELRSRNIRVRTIPDPNETSFGTESRDLTYDGEEVLDFALFDDQDDFYLQKKRQHQQQAPAQEEKKPRTRKDTPKPAARKPQPAEEVPEKPVKKEPAREEDIQIHMPSYDFGEPDFGDIPIVFGEKTQKEKPDDGVQTVLDDYVESAKEDSPIHHKRTGSVLPASMQPKDEPLSEEEAEALVEELDLSGKPVLQEYQFPSIELLHPGSNEENGESREDLLRNARTLENSLLSFGVEAKVLQVNKGPSVTRYELQPSEGVRVSRIMNLADDIALNLATSGIRIEGPIPGKKALGIEVPNKETTSVNLREVIDSDQFRKLSSPLAFALGKDIDGNVQVTDIAKMPHLLIAGATGSGKSVCINCLLMSIIYKAKPEDVGLILIDPKVVELSVYNGIPHLLAPVVTDPKKAALSLNWAVTEMTKRYKQFSDAQVRDIKGFNEWVEANPDCGQPRMKRIVIVVDELADLMMVASKEVEDYICRLAQMARAAGIHLVIATQRPSVDVITGLIKANIPSRLAFAVSSGVDSRTILDMVGAEKLLGRGDMLFAPIGASKPIRIQGAFVSDHEVEDVVAAVKQPVTASDPDLEDAMKGNGSSAGGGPGSEEDDLDEFLEQAIQYVVDKQKASISMLQRVFRIGFNRAARLMDALEDRGIVGPDEGSKPRKVLVTSEELDSSDQDF